MDWLGARLASISDVDQRARTLSQNPAFLTLIEKGIAISKSGITFYSVIQALSHKSGLRTKGIIGVYFSRIPVWVSPPEIEFGSRFLSLRDDHFPRFRRWRPTLTMSKYI